MYLNLNVPCVREVAFQEHAIMLKERLNRYNSVLVRIPMIPRYDSLSRARA